jgi:uncharacterized membrane protein
MSFCISCGSPLNPNTQFCGACGAPLPAAGTASPGGEVAEPGASAVASFKTAAALAYLLTVVTGLYFLLAEPYRRDRYVRFHSLQAILYYLAAVAIWTIYWIASFLLRLLSFGLSSWITLPASILLALAMFGYWIILMYKAYQGEHYKIPYLGDIADSSSQSEELSSSVAGSLSYVLAFVTGIIFLLSNRYKRDPLVRFHAFQSIFASIAYFAVVIFWSVVTGALFVASLGTLWIVLLLGWMPFGRPFVPAGST